MFLIRSRSDLVFFLVLCTLINAMGLLMLFNPLPHLPLDPGAYRPHSGYLAQIISAPAGRSRRATFLLADEAQQYETMNSRHVAEAVAHWRPGITPISFYLLRETDGDARPDRPRTVYGLRAGLQTISSLEADIAAHNAIADTKGEYFALAIGLGGYLVAFLLWRRRRV